VVLDEEDVDLVVSNLCLAVAWVHPEKNFSHAASVSS
jgi:hypothetical protein